MHALQVIDIPNSMTVLPELLPYSLEMAKRKLTGAASGQVGARLQCSVVQQGVR